jgi:hypothetical protein
MSNRPMVARFPAIRTSQAAAIQAPIRVQRVSTSRPTAISMIPTTCMNVWGETGSRLAIQGLRYFGQSVSRLRNLSSPASSGTSP